jgi:hypothetical protein
MRRLAIVFGLALTALVGCARRTTQVSDFKKFTSPLGRFSVELPGVPEFSDHPVKTKYGTVTAHAFSVRLGAIEFLVVDTDVPQKIADAIKRSSADRALEATGSDLARLTQSRVVSEKTIALGKWPGREWEMQGTGAGPEDSRWQCYVAGDRQYKLCAGWFRGHKPSDEVLNKFFSSFTILSQ